MISVFAGEFLFHPAGIEISGNHCSHNCVYCFAHTRSSGRIMKLQSVINRLQRKEPKVYLDWLIKLGYPICFSNNTDPFSDNNYVQTNAIAHYLANMPNGLFMQTKGGKGIDEFIENLNGKKNVVWYITITTNDDVISKQIEPNAPLSSERIALAKKLHDMGYMVIIGINPLYDKYLPYDNFVKFVNQLKDIGLYIWVQQLHINKKEMVCISDKRKQTLGLDDCKYLESQEYFNYYEKCTDYLRDNNFNFTEFNTPYVTGLIKKLRSSLGKIMPMNAEFIEYLYTLDYSKGIIVGSKMYIDFMRKGNEELFKMRFKDIDNNYILRYAFGLWKGNKDVQNIDNFEDLLKLVWDNCQFRNSPVYNLNFKIIMDANDDDGGVLLYFDGNTHTRDENEWICYINNTEV